MHSSHQHLTHTEL